MRTVCFWATCALAILAFFLGSDWEPFAAASWVILALMNDK